MDADRTIADIASAQHSVVTRKQLLAAGIADHLIDHRRVKGQLLAVHAGVYRLNGHPQSWHQVVMAAVLAAGPNAAASHRAAAMLLGIPDIGPRAEVSVRAHRSLDRPGVVLHRVAQLGPPDTGLVAGIPCTRPARTLIDLAGVVPAASLELALDHCLSRRMVSVEYLNRRLDSLGRQGRDGARALADLLGERSGAQPRTHGEFERLLVTALVGGGLPVPQTQFHVALPGGGNAFLDAAYPEMKVGIEADSYRHHSSRTDWGRDHTRNRMLMAIGWRILPVTWDDVFPDSREVVALIGRTLKEIPLCVG